jgi:hypothetical protein
MQRLINNYINIALSMTQKQLRKTQHYRLKQKQKQIKACHKRLSKRWELKRKRGVGKSVIKNENL